MKIGRIHCLQCISGDAYLKSIERWKLVLHWMLNYFSKNIFRR